MKKTLLPLVLLALTLLFTSCDNGINGLLELFTGDATSVVNGDSEDKYTSSIIMFNENSDPTYAIGLATAMDVTELVHISGVKDLEFPFLTYRLVHNNLSANTRLEVENTLTEGFDSSQFSCAFGLADCLESFAVIESLCTDGFQR